MEEAMINMVETVTAVLALIGFWVVVKIWKEF